MSSVYVQTNDAAGNEVLVFERLADGRLGAPAAVATGGRGSGEPHLPSQGSVVLSDDGAWLLVTNAGSDDVSLFAVDGDGLRLADRVACGGETPVSVATRGGLVYVLDNASASVAGLAIDGDRLVALEGSARSLRDGADPAQVGFAPDGATFVVTERGTDAISTFVIDDRGRATGPATIASCGPTPYGFAFAADGTLVVTEAFRAAAGAAAASSYALREPGLLEPLSASVRSTRSEVCWAAVAGGFAYVTNFGDGSISSYRIGDDGSLELAAAVAASTRLGQKGPRDEAITPDGRRLYAIDPDARRIFGWELGAGGELAEIGAFEGVPATVAGLAAS